MLSLVQNLKVGSVESLNRLDHMLAEDPQIAHERKDLISKIGSLEKVVAELRTLQM